METLREHGRLKSCVLANELPHFVTVSVEPSDALSDTGTDPVGVTYVTDDRHGPHSLSRSCHGVPTLITDEINKDAHQGSVRAIEPEDLGHQPDVSLLTTDSESMTLATGQVIHQLQIQHELEERGPPNGDDTPEVILVYQDIFTCGACSKQFVDLTEFLEHKTHHTIGAVFHKCDLCQVVFRSQALIAEHYQKLHQVNFFAGGQTAQHAGNVADDNEQVENGTDVIENLAVTEKDDQVNSVDMESLQNVTKVMMTGGLSVGMVNGEICASEDNEGSTLDSADPTGDRQVVFVQSALPSVREDLPVADHVDTQQEAVTVEALSASPTPATEISLLKPGSEGQTLIEHSLTNGLHTILDDNAVGAETLSTNEHSEPCEAKRATPGTGLGIGSEPNADSRPDFNFILQTEMVKGSTFTYGKTWFKCLHCDFKTNAKVTISKHMQEHHVNLIDLHQNLEVKDVTGNDKRKVMKMSTYENIFGRESRFRRRTKKGKRVEKQDGPAVYNCGTCGKVFTRIRYLRKHQGTHRTEKKYLCDECGKSYKSRTYLQVHRRIHKEKLFHCNQCDFKSKINAAIHAHRQVHSQGSVLCDICGYAYTDKSTLSKHKRVHDVNRPYKCNFSGCTWRFKTEVMCKAHIRAHTTEGKFKCSFCGYLFRHKHHLQRHETSMHGVKHTKTRTNQTAKSVLKKHTSSLDDADLTDTVNLVINAEGDDSPMQLQGDGGTQHLVVATDTQGTPIAFEGTDLSALNVAYQTLFQNQEGSGRTLIMTQPDTQIIFKQGY